MSDLLRIDDHTEYTHDAPLAEHPLLRAHPLLEGLAADVRREAMAMARRLELGFGQPLVRADGPTGGLYVVLEGHVRTTWMRGAVEQHLIRQGPGALIGALPEGSEVAAHTTRVSGTRTVCAWWSRASLVRLAELPGWSSVVQAAAEEQARLAAWRAAGAQTACPMASCWARSARCTGSSSTRRASRWWATAACACLARAWSWWLRMGGVAVFPGAGGPPGRAPRRRGHRADRRPCGGLGAGRREHGCVARALSGVVR